MVNFSAWAKEFRVRFLIFVSLPVCLGSAIAYTFYPGSFSILYFGLAALAMLLLHAGTIITNDYFDFVSGTDVINKARTPYSGGSGLLPDRVLRPGHVLAVGLLCFALCTALGLYIVAFRSPAVLLVGMAGVALGLAYTTPPLKLCYRGLGEAARFIATPLIVLGAFLVQVPIASTAELQPALPALTACLASSVPVALLNTAALYIFEFPDYEADSRVGKRNLVVRLGPWKAAYLFLAMQAIAYLSLLAFILSGIVPMTAALAFVLLPASAYAAWGLLRHSAEAKKLLPYLRASSHVYIASSIILALAFVV